MEIEGDYRRDGYALVHEMVPRALMARLKADMPPRPITLPTETIDGTGEPRPANFTFADTPVRG